MNVIGFLSIHDPGSSCSMNFENIPTDSNLESGQLETIISYLKTGVPTIKFVSELFDVDGDRIGPHIIYTDGIWIWPSYYGFYLRKYFLQVPAEFLKHINKIKENKIQLLEGEKLYVEYIISKMFGFKATKDFSILKDLIDKRGEDISCF